MRCGQERGPAKNIEAWRKICAFPDVDLAGLRQLLLAQTVRKGCGFGLGRMKQCAVSAASGPIVMPAAGMRAIGKWKAGRAKGALKEMTELPMMPLSCPTGTIDPWYPRASLSYGFTSSVRCEASGVAGPACRLHTCQAEGSSLFSLIPAQLLG